MISYIKDMSMIEKLSYSIATLDIIHLNFVVGFRQIVLSIYIHKVSMDLTYIATVTIIRLCMLIQRVIHQNGGNG